MATLHEFAVSTISFIVLISLMVIIHELGHFLAARACGVRVEAFSIGMGPRLFGITRGETEYKVCLLPVGGYVKMTGQESGEDAEPKLDDPASFSAHPRWQRMAIAVAGPVANIVLAFVLMVIYYAAFNEMPKVTLKPAAVDWVIPDSDAARAGIQPDDVIQSFDSIQTPDWRLVNTITKRNFGKTVKATILRGGQTLDLLVHIPKPAKTSGVVMDSIGLLPKFTNEPIDIASAIPGDSAAAELRKGDKIVTINGLHFHYMSTIEAYLQINKDKPLNIGLLRDGSMHFVLVKPTKVDDMWYLGVLPDVPFEKARLSLGQVISNATSDCVDATGMLIKDLRQLLTGQVSVKELSGPIGIAQMAGIVTEMNNWFAKFTLASALSINLAVFNLLPFPILDGGLIAMLLIESIRRKDISIVAKKWAYNFAFVALVCFFVFVMFNDVSKLGIFAAGR